MCFFFVRNLRRVVALSADWSTVICFFTNTNHCTIIWAPLVKFSSESTIEEGEHCMYCWRRSLVSFDWEPNSRVLLEILDCHVLSSIMRSTGVDGRLSWRFITAYRSNRIYPAPQMLPKVLLSAREESKAALKHGRNSIFVKSLVWLRIKPSVWYLYAFFNREE